LKVKKILVSQPKPKLENSPYWNIQKKFNLKIDFHKFIRIDGVKAREFRKERINILEHNAVIFTSRLSVDHFFRICTEMRIRVPESMKYFCVSESIAYYLQKYVRYRKRKIFSGEKKFKDLMGKIEKYKEDKFLFPCSNIHKQEIPKLLEKNKIKYSIAVIYKTLCSNLSNIDINKYDMLVFFSPLGIESLFKNFPDYKQEDSIVAVFGPTTAKSVKKAGLTLSIEAPTPQAPSMTMAIEQYLQKMNKKSKNKKN
jgi:uroporphyrinogen-III synthase